MKSNQKFMGNIFKAYVNKGLMSRIYNRLLPLISLNHKILKDPSPKMVYGWQVSI